MYRNAFVILIAVALVTCALWATAHAKVASEQSNLQQLGSGYDYTYTMIFDASVLQYNPDTNYGYDDTSWVGRFNGGGMWTYMKNWYCPGWTVTWARLWVYITQNTGDVGELIVRVPAGSWLEGSITWNNQPGGTTPAEYTVAISGTGWDWYTATWPVQSVCNEGGDNYGIMFIYDFSHPDGRYIGFEAYEAGGTNRPYIETNDAVDISDFFTAGLSDGIHVFWSTTEEIDNLGWNVYRADEKNGPFTKLNDKVLPAYQYDYEFVDSSAEIGTPYYYQVEDIDLDGTITLHGPVFGIFWEDAQPADGNSQGDEDEGDLSDGGSSESADAEDSGGGCGF